MQRLIAPTHRCCHSRLSRTLPGRGLASVFAQTLRPTQIIVVDDGSPDRGVIDNVVTPYRDRLTRRAADPR